MAMLSFPGMIDVHVHLREPGATQKEDIFTGTRAALAGGVIAVLDMPNNVPPTIDRPSLEEKKRLFALKAVTDYGIFLGYVGGDVQPLLDLADQVVGLKLYIDETFGDLRMGTKNLEHVFEVWPGPGPIAVHAESSSIPVVLELAERYKQRLHVCHVPHPDDLLLIEAARQRGVEVTCEVTPHHLFLSLEDAQRLGPYGYMKPPLLPPAEVALFWERLSLIDVIASDHAPHTKAEKVSSHPPPGVPGLETTLPLLLYAVDEGRLSWERVLELIWENPLRIFRLIPPKDSEVQVILEEPYKLTQGGYYTRCGWSPFGGKWALGRVHSVRLHGQTVWQEGQLLVDPGYGRPLRHSS